MLLGQHLFHHLQLGPEHSGNKIWSVLRSLAWKQLIQYLLPVWVAGHRQEDVRLAVRLHQCHGIHMPPFHVSVAPWNDQGRTILVPTAFAWVSPAVMLSAMPLY